MRALQDPLERLVDELTWFADTPETRVLHVRTSETLRQPVVDHIQAEEYAPANRSAYLISRAKSDDWDERSTLLLDEYNIVRDAMLEFDSPVELPSLSVRRAGFAGFAGLLVDIVAATRPPLERWVITLMATGVVDSEKWASEVRQLLQQPTLKPLHWILVDVESDALGPIAESYGAEGLQVDARVDPKAVRRELSAIIAQMNAAPVGASPAQLAGGAGPTIAPPARWDAPPIDAATQAQTQAALAEQGVSAAYTKPTGVKALLKLQVEVLSASEAAQDNDFTTAVRRQQCARKIAQDLELGKEEIILGLISAAYLVQGGAGAAAGREFEGLRDQALRLSMTDATIAPLAVQAQLGFAATLLVDAKRNASKRSKAAVAYAEAGRLGVNAGETVLAIEGFRMAGSLLIDLKRTEDGARAYRRALEVAEAAEPVDRILSSAPDVARALAAVYRNLRMTVQADSLESQASQMENEAAVLADELADEPANESAQQPANGEN